MASIILDSMCRVNVLTHEKSRVKTACSRRGLSCKEVVSDANTTTSTFVISGEGVVPLVDVATLPMKPKSAEEPEENPISSVTHDLSAIVIPLEIMSRLLEQNSSGHELTKAELCSLQKAMKIARELRLLSAYDPKASSSNKAPLLKQPARVIGGKAQFSRDLSAEDVQNFVTARQCAFVCAVDALLDAATEIDQTVRHQKKRFKT